MIIGTDINELIEFLQKAKENGYTQVQVIGKYRKSGWFSENDNYGIEFLKNESYPNVIGINGEYEFRD